MERFDHNYTANYVLLILTLFFLITCNQVEKGTRIKIDYMKSEYVDERNVEIWLPPSYHKNEHNKYPVIYMHDGQNLFEQATAYGGNTWGVPETVIEYSKRGKIPEVIVVGIWNTPKRFREYMPDKPFYMMNEKIQNVLIKEYEGEPLGDEYLKFIVNELKPMIDSTYRTKPDQKNTFIMGSSMGGLISAYAITEYPEIFRGAGCLSSHFLGSLQYNGPEFSDAFAMYFSEHLPSPKNHKYYFDYGTKTLDALYGPHQLKVDSVMEQSGYMNGVGWVTLKFEGSDHTELSWQKRLHIPLEFLLNKN
ncbi:MAG: alpha/beta hydrolase [Bacteroidales bacterium]|nr:alpha/beta hydrolase [Bacteroidales bacterium]